MNQKQRDDEECSGLMPEEAEAVAPLAAALEAGDENAQAAARAQQQANFAAKRAARAAKLAGKAHQVVTKTAKPEELLELVEKAKEFALHEDANKLAIVGALAASTSLLTEMVATARKGASGAMLAALGVGRAWQKGDQDEAAKLRQQADFMASLSTKTADAAWDYLEKIIKTSESDKHGDE